MKNFLFCLLLFPLFSFASFPIELDFQSSDTIIRNGKIYVDGNSKNLTETDWRKNVNYVSQSTSLFDDSIRNNIAFGILFFIFFLILLSPNINQ